ncbi:MAG: methyltransferase domain-containing protein [Candidatus Lokiarchaeota archaeon]|nr:methyltransferase domain-containing protein [Candidatus Lokiarchaeota archaeon]
METVEKGWDEFWAELFRVKHRSTIPGIQQYDNLVVDFCIETLKLQEGDEILDIACGAGDHSIKFAQKGLQVTGFDISQTLIAVADKKASDAGVEVNLFRGDMREINFVKRFSGAVILSHSFGFFNHEENLRVLEGSFNALIDGGRLLLDLMNPYNLPKFQKTWSKIENGYLLSEPHSLDAPSGVLKGRPALFVDSEKARIILMDQDAMSNNDIRMYTALEIRAMLEDVGFKRIELFGQNKLPKMPYSANCERMVVIAEK